MADTHQVPHRPKLQVAAEIAVILTGVVAVAGATTAIVQWFFSG